MMVITQEMLPPVRPVPLSRLEEALRAVSPAGVVWATVQRQRGRVRFHRRVVAEQAWERMRRG